MPTFKTPARIVKPTSKPEQGTAAGKRPPAGKTVGKTTGKTLPGKTTAAKSKKSTAAANGGADGGDKPKKRKKKVLESYGMYIHRVLKQVHPDFSISKTAMSNMNSLVYDLFERLACEARDLAQKSKHSTMMPRDVQTASKLILPGELGKHGQSEGIKATHKYKKYQQSMKDR